MRRFQITVSGKSYDVSVAATGETFAVTVNGASRTAHVSDITRGRFHMLIDNVSREVDYRKTDDGWVLFLDGYEYHVDTIDFHLAALRSTATVTHAARMPKELKAPMPGLTLRVDIVPGQKVVKGDTLLILEAMKMENIIKATGEGVVKKVLIEPRTSVEKGQALATFE